MPVKYIFFDSMSSQSHQQQQQQQQRKGQEFLCKIRFKNPLPEIPFGPKLLSHPVDEAKYALYNPQNEWLKSVPFPVIASDNDIGMPVDLVDMAALKSASELASSIVVPAEDDILLKGPSTTLAEPVGRYRPAVPWLRRTEYISNVDSKSFDRQRAKDSGVEELVQRHIAENGAVDMSREGQIRTVEKSFQAASKWDQTIDKQSHPHKSGVHAVESWPVLPGRGSDGSPSGTYAQCTFDHIPDNMTGNNADVLLKVYQGDAKSELEAARYQYIVLFANQEERAYKRSKLYDFQMARYVGNEKLAFVFSPKDSAIMFYEISARFALRKKRDTAGSGNDIPGRLVLTEKTVEPIETGMEVDGAEQ